MRNGYAQIPGIGSIPYTLQPVNPNTDLSTAATIADMRQVVQHSADHPAVVAATRQALGCVGSSAPAWRKAQAIWEWVHGNIRFEPDEQQLSEYYGLPEDMELLQRPELVLATRVGDCDCFTMLVCSMLAAAGVGSRIVTVKADQGEPHRWSHVYPVAVMESGSTIPMDASHGRWFGWEVPAGRVFARKEWAC